MDPQILGPVCTTPSPLNCIELQSPGQGLRPGRLCLRHSPSLGLPPPVHPKAQPGASPAFPHSPALRTAESNVTTPLHSPGGPPPALPHPTTSPQALSHPTKPTPSAKPTRCTAANMIGAAPFPVRPRPAKRHVSPVRKCAGRMGCPRVGYRGRVPKAPSSCTSAPQGARPPPETQAPPDVWSSFSPRRLPGRAHLSDCFLLH